MLITLPKSLAPPTHCPHCKTAVFIDGAFPRCMNFNCWYRVYGRLQKFVDVLDIKGAGEETLKQIAKEGLALTAADLFTIPKDKFCKLERQGSKGYAKFVEGLKARTNLSTTEFYAALDIEGRGTFDAITVVPGLQTVEDIRTAALQNKVALFAKAVRVSPERARDIIKEIQERISEIDALFKVVQIKTAGSKLLGKAFCITGTLSRKRHEIETLIKDAGGRVQSSVTGDTTHLISNEVGSGSSKMKKALALNIPIITEETFFNTMLNE